MLPLRQSTASQTVSIGPFIDDTDFKTPETALTIANTDIKLRKHSAASEVNKNSGGATHEASGRYEITFDATDTNTAGRLQIAVNVAGALPVWQEFTVLPADVWDSLYGDSGPAPMFGVLDQGTAQSASGTGLVLRAAAAFADNTLIGNVVLAFGSTQGYWQARFITDNALSGDSVTIDPAWTVTPSGTITYKILAAPASPTADASLPPVHVQTVATDAVDAAALATDAANEIRDAVFARAFSAAYGSHTFDELVKLVVSVLVGKASGMATTTATFRKLDDSGDAVTATVDASGNRTTVIRTP